MDDLSMIRVEAGVRLIARCTMCPPWAGRMDLDVVLGHARAHRDLGGTHVTDGEPITERAVFTQRDVDPLGRGNAVCGDWQRRHPGAAQYRCSMGAGHEGAHRAVVEGELMAGWPRVQASDLHKCDENTLRSENR